MIDVLRERRGGLGGQCMWRAFGQHIWGAPRATVVPGHNLGAQTQVSEYSLLTRKHRAESWARSKGLVLGHSAPRRGVQQKRAVRTTTLTCLLTACTNPAPLAQEYKVVLQGSADAGIARIRASYCRRDGARATRVAPLWAARRPSPPLPAMLHAACGVS